MASLQLEPLGRRSLADRDSLDVVYRLRRAGCRLFHRHNLGERVKASALLEAGELARARLLSRRGEPLFYAHWDNVLFIHFETDPQILQRDIPFELDLYDDRAFV